MDSGIHGIVQLASAH